MISCIYFFIALIITIVIHELAHMVVALLCKAKVFAFGFGFGKILLHKKLWNIEFRLCLFPLGGYVKLEPDNKKEGKNLLAKIKNWWKGTAYKPEWLTKRYSKKLAIVLAGVTVNLLIAFLCYWINYKSIKLGLYVDYKLSTSIFTKDHLTIYVLIATLQPNLFILQLGLMNLFAALTNIMIFPSLDGGYIWLLLLEKPLKEKFIPFIEKITKIGFIILIILQLVLIYYIWMV